MSALAPLVGARVVRVDLPRPHLLCLTLETVEGTVCVFVGLAAPDAGLYARRRRVDGDPATPEVSKLRHHLVGARLESTTSVEGGALELRWARAEHRTILTVFAGKLGWNAELRTADGRPIAKAGVLAGQPERVPVPEGSLAEWIARSEAWSAEQTAQVARGKVDDGLARLQRDARTLKRRLAAVEGDLARILEAPRIRHHAELLLANLHAIAPNATEATVVDWNLPDSATVTIAIDPALGAKRFAETLFARARRLDRGKSVGEKRRDETLAALARLEERKRALLAGEEIAGDAKSTASPAARTLERVGRASTPDARVPYRAFIAANGRVVLVGRGAKDNDALTLSLAKPHDLWLHARGTEGAHVVVPLDRGASCPGDLLVDAAHLAAHFSSARGEPVVDVQYVERRHVRKRKGSPPGAVQVEREKVLALRLDADRLAALLAAEQKRQA